MQQWFGTWRNMWPTLLNAVVSGPAKCQLRRSTLRSVIFQCGNFCIHTIVSRIIFSAVVLYSSLWQTFALAGSIR